MLPVGQVLVITDATRSGKAFKAVLFSSVEDEREVQVL